MTNSFQWNSLLTATWWKTNSFMWYIMAIVSICTGLMAYAHVSQGGNQLKTSNYGLFFLATLLIFCSALAAFSYLRKHLQTAQVNLRKAGSLLVLTTVAAALCVVVTAPELLTLACFIAAALALGISLKNGFIWLWLR